MRFRRPDLIAIFMLLIALVAWIGVFLFPVFSLLRASQVPGESAWLSQFFATWLDPLLLSKVRFTAWQAGCSALISCVLGLPLGLFLRHSPRATDTLKLPFGVPTLVASAAWISILSQTSVLYSFGAVLVAHVVLNVPWVASLIAEASAAVPVSWDEQARSLGAGKFDRWRVVFYPVIAPALFSAFSQVFMLCSMSFTLVLLLGGGPPVETLETAIFASVRTGSLDLKTGASLALWQLILSMLPWLGLRIWWKPLSIPVPSTRTHHEPMWHRAFALLWVIPYFSFFRDLDFGVFASKTFWVELRSPLLLSLGLALLVGIVSILWSAIVMVALFLLRGDRKRKLMESIFLLPSGVSTLTLSLGFWLAYSRWIDPFEGSVTALVLIQALIFFPLVFRWLWPLVQHRSEQAMDAARSLGASRWQAWMEVEWPRLRQPFIHAVALVSAASVGELAAVSFFSSERMVTLPVLVSRWLTQYRFEYAHAVAAVLLIISGVLTWGSRWER